MPGDANGGKGGDVYILPTPQTIPSRRAHLEATAPRGSPRVSFIIIDARRSWLEAYIWPRWWHPELQMDLLYGWMMD